MRYSYCCVPGCYSKNNGELTFFTCNARWQPIIREKCSIPGWTLAYRSIICERHFEVKFLRKFHLQDVHSDVMTDFVLTKGASPTIFHNDLLSQIPQTSKCDSGEEINEYIDLRISNTSLTNKSEGKMSKIPENNGRSISDTDKSNRGNTNSHSQIGRRVYKTNSHRSSLNVKDSCENPNKSDMLHNIPKNPARDLSNSYILNKYSSVESKSYKTPESTGRIQSISKPVIPSIIDSNILNKENSNICSPIRWFQPPLESDRIIEYSKNDSYHNQQDLIIKLEPIDDQLEELTEVGQIQQINCTYSNISDENVNIRHVEDALPIKEEIGEYIDLNICNTSIPNELEAKMSKLPEMTVGVISDSDILNIEHPNPNTRIGTGSCEIMWMNSSRSNGEISSTCSSNITESEKRESIHNTHKSEAPSSFDSSNIKILNKYSSGAAKSFKAVRRKDKSHNTPNTAGPSRLDSYVLNNEISNICLCSPISRWVESTFNDVETIGNSKNVSYQDQEAEVIKQEIIDDQEVEGIRDDYQIEQINCGFTDVKEENINIIGEVLPTEEEGCNTPIPEKYGVNLSEILKINIDLLKKKQMTEYETLTFDSVVSNKLLKKTPSVPSQSSITPRKNDKIHDTNTTAGPSRFDSEVLNDDSSTGKWLFEPSHEHDEIIGSDKNDSILDQQEVIIKKEIIDVQIEGITKCPQIEQIHCGLPDIRDETENINKRRGSSLDETEIKKEKMDDEAYITQNHIIVKNEVHEEVKINTEHRNDDTTKNSSYHVVNDEIVKEGSELWEPEAKIWARKKICLLCDIYVGGTMNDHIAEHHMEGIFISCPYCDRSSQISPLHKSFQPAELKRHLQNFLLNCELCVETCRTWMDLNIHMNQQHSVKMSNTCSICGFKTMSYLHLVDHIFGSHNGGTLVHNCQHCAFATLNTERLKYHMEMKHRVLPPPQVVRKKPPQPNKVREYQFKKMLKKCPCCDFKSTYSATLKRHMDNNHAE